MSQLFLHPDVKNYFVEADYSNPIESSKVVDQYEAGKVILLRNIYVDHDAKFLESMAVPQEPEFKKFKSVRFLSEWNRSRQGLPDRVLDRCFGGDKGRFNYFAQQVRSVNAQVTQIAKRLFPKYVYINSASAWRLTDTVNENLHVDVYNEDLPDHHLRMFVNLDTRPRIWHTSYELEYLLAHKLSLLDPEFVRTASAGRICHALNFAVFKGLEQAGREGCPKHIAFFDPGAVWLVDSRKIAHQIFYGRMALSTEYAVKTASMSTPSLHYFDVVRRYVDHGGT